MGARIGKYTPVPLRPCPSQVAVGLTLFDYERNLRRDNYIRKRIMQISDAESRVMQVLWDHGPGTAEDVVQALAQVSDWQDATIKTLLNRLLKKGALVAETEGRRYRYRPVLARDAYVLEESRSLVERLFDGRVAPLVAHFSRHGQLDADDIAQLRRLIEEIDDEH